MAVEHGRMPVEMEKQRCGRKSVRGMMLRACECHLEGDDIDYRGSSRWFARIFNREPIRVREPLSHPNSLPSLKPKAAPYHYYVVTIDEYFQELLSHTLRDGSPVRVVSIGFP